MSLAPAIDKVLYTAQTHTTGGREGAAQSSDGRLDVKLSPPGSAGNGTNPEQMFAAGWSACFIGAMGRAASNLKVKLPADVAVDADVAVPQSVYHVCFPYTWKPCFLKVFFF